MWVDELENNEDLKNEATDKLGDWEITNLVNGWTEGPQYGRKVEQDCGKREVNTILVISDCYPPKL